MKSPVWWTKLASGYMSAFDYTLNTQYRIVSYRKIAMEMSWCEGGKSDFKLPRLVVVVCNGDIS